MNEYIKPDFSVMEYEIDDIITDSGFEIDTSDPDGGGDWL